MALMRFEFAKIYAILNKDIVINRITFFLLGQWFYYKNNIYIYIYIMSFYFKDDQKSILLYVILNLLRNVYLIIGKKEERRGGNRGTDLRYV